MAFHFSTAKLRIIICMAKKIADLLIKKLFKFYHFCSFYSIQN